jgi:hypothetical protein
MTTAAQWYILECFNIDLTGNDGRFDLFLIDLREQGSLE